MIFIYTISAVILVSLISLIGILLFWLRIENLHKITHYLVSFAIGTLLGGAFLHLLPEALEKSSIQTTFLFVIIGILLFFIIEKYIHWRHCHEDECEYHATAQINLIGDAIHNFMDGVAIAVSFLVNVPTGIATTIAIAIHEIPQELGDFGILLHCGYSKTKAIFYNLLTALVAVVGAVLTLVFASYVQNLVFILMPITAGGFIYLAGTDLFPELHKEKNISSSLMQVLLLVLGIFLMLILKIYFAGVV